ncbi:hypothetical protein [Meridianimarinicoccus marinus]|uniref:hypothetical protein n=1 Tax=Meridianimarinicoccus marinus TaxID=3231483 RepID=UPI00344B3432
MFADIESFHTPMRKDVNNGMPSPVKFEIRKQKLIPVGVWETRGASDNHPVETRAGHAPTIKPDQSHQPSIGHKPRASITHSMDTRQTALVPLGMIAQKAGP